jgi:hypothetical protein
MGNFQGYKALIAALNELSDQLEQGNTTESDLQRFVDLSRELYERSVILNYKAIEKEVYLKKEAADPAPNDDQPAQKTPDLENVQKPNDTEQPVFDFSSDDANKEEDDFSFDFANDKEIKLETATDELKDEQIDNAEEERIEESEVIEEKHLGPKTTITTERKTEISSDEKVISFYEKFTQVHDESLLAILGSQKIDSLKGAFGFNDRLQIINELFHGNSDEFNAAIEKLDNLSSDEEARVKLSEIAAHHQWEADHRLVEDFAKMVDRRYAE